MLQGILHSLRPAVVAMIASSGVLILITAFWGNEQATLLETKWVMVGIFMFALLLLRKTKINPISVMILSGFIKVVSSMI